MGAIDLEAVERRSEQRISVGNEVVLVDLCDGRGPVTCCMWDVSEGGACVMIPPDVSVPQSFKLLIGERWRKAGVVWRRWSHVGVRFTQ